MIAVWYGPLSGRLWLFCDQIREQNMNLDHEIVIVDHGIVMLHCDWLLFPQ
jgi:hypothetical protein